MRRFMPFAVLRKRWVSMLVAITLATAGADAMSALQDRRQGQTSGAGFVVLVDQPLVTANRAENECLVLPVDAPDERLLGPHGDTLITTKCSVIGYEAVDRGSPPKWFAAHYEWTSVFTAEDSTRGNAAQDTATEEDVVLYELAQRDQLRPVWHARFEADTFGIWRSIVPEVVSLGDGTMLLSMMACVNGTGGCSQDFLHRRSDGSWLDVRQRWLEQLPGGFVGRIRHGVRIDPYTLQGEPGFYRDDDPNCCPSQQLLVVLDFRDESLVLREKPIVKDVRQ
jgi:hypothetical protein